MLPRTWTRLAVRGKVSDRPSNMNLTRSYKDCHENVMSTSASTLSSCRKLSVLLILSCYKVTHGNNYNQNHYINNNKSQKKIKSRKDYTNQTSVLIMTCVKYVYRQDDKIKTPNSTCCAKTNDVKETKISWPRSENFETQTEPDCDSSRLLLLLFFLIL